jgi:hypothetical protein
LPAREAITVAVRRRPFLGALACAASVVSGCGYRPVYGGASPELRLGVVAGSAAVPRPEALQAALAGLRDELSQAGALAPGSAYPRVVLELLRIDEISSGIAAVSGPSGTQPLGRGSSVGVLGRAWVEEAAGAEPARDTGDMRRVVRYASSDEGQLEARRHTLAVRAAARELGRALGRRILGQPEPANEPL